MQFYPCEENLPHSLRIKKSNHVNKKTTTTNERRCRISLFFVVLFKNNIARIKTRNSCSYQVREEVRKALPSCLPLSKDGYGSALLSRARAGWRPARAARSATHTGPTALRPGPPGLALLGPGPPGVRCSAALLSPPQHDWQLHCGVVSRKSGIISGGKEAGPQQQQELP